MEDGGNLTVDSFRLIILQKYNHLALRLILDFSPNCVTINWNQYFKQVLILH